MAKANGIRTRWVLLALVGLCWGVLVLGSGSSAVGCTEEELSFSGFLTDLVAGDWTANTEDGVVLLRLRGNEGRLAYAEQNKPD